LFSTYAIYNDLIYAVYWLSSPGAFFISATNQSNFLPNEDVVFIPDTISFVPANGLLLNTFTFLNDYTYSTESYVFTTGALPPSNGGGVPITPVLLADSYANI